VVDPTSVQPPVTEPPEGFWTVQQIFPVLPQASYSENGKRQLLYKAQGLLKEQGFYSATHDGKEGKGTHNAIVLFQARNSLIGNGLLDGPTLKAMDLAALPDDPEWQSPAMSSGVRKKSYSSKSKAAEDQSILQKAGKSIGRFFGKD
jgi:peptidoglycan hydrolase-like protein with peptidoglycan-binding domain